MFAVEVRDHVMVAHSFRGEMFGPAQGLHGATFVIDAAFMAEALDPNGVVVDIGRAHEVLRAIVKDINYRNLDDLPEFRRVDRRQSSRSRSLRRGRAEPRPQRRGRHGETARRPPARRAPPRLRTTLPLS